MLEKIKTIISTLKRKWVQKECRHMCALCEYKSECEVGSYSIKGM